VAESYPRAAGENTRISVDTSATQMSRLGVAMHEEHYCRRLTVTGFFWGGSFKSRKDPMHFQLATGY
jgi:hypothetical protein